MKLLIIFILLSLNYCSSDKNGKEIEEDDEYVGNPDDFAEIERPCQVYDLYCSRKFFASHAKCTIAKGPIPDPYVRTQMNLYYPRINMSIINPNAELIGLNRTRIEEFYINKATNKVVFAINIRGFATLGRNVYFEFYRRDRESVVTVAPAFILYSSITFTAIIPNINNMQLDQAEVTAFSDDAFPPFLFSPSALDSSDPTIALRLADFASQVPIDIRELMLTDAAFYPPFYIQNNICDFGLKLV